MEKLQEVKMKISKILTLIETIRSYNNAGAQYTSHPYGNAEVEYMECSDADVITFTKNLIEGKNISTLIMGDARWTKGGNCIGDELLPSSIIATKLPDGRYYLEVEYSKWTEKTSDIEDYGWIRFKNEYVYSPATFETVCAGYTGEDKNCYLYSIDELTNLFEYAKDKGDISLNLWEEARRRHILEKSISNQSDWECHDGKMVFVG